MVKDTKFLEQRNGIYWVQLSVPKAAQGVIGKRVLRASLKTRDARIANEEKGRFITLFRRMIRAALTPEAKQNAGGNIKLALALRRSSSPDKAAMIDAEVQELGVDWETGELEPEAARFLDIASGKATPLTLYLNDFIKAYGVNHERRTVEARRHAITELAAWMKNEDLPPNVEAVSRLVASRFKSSMVQAGAAVDTVNKALAGPRLYWQWLVDTGHMPEGASNPWTRQSLPKSRDEPTERAFTPQELDKLFQAAKERPLLDFMAIAALTGMRRGEVMALTVADCRHGFIHIHQGKTRNARRNIPVHSLLAPVIKRLSNGKTETDRLFADRRINRRGPMHPVLGDATGKRFNRFRADALGKDSGADTNIRSFRRYFATRLRFASIDEASVAYLMGHAHPHITFGLYARLRPSEMSPDQLTELHDFYSPKIEAVTLPPKAARTIKKNTPHPDLKPPQTHPTLSATESAEG